MAAKAVIPNLKDPDYSALKDSANKKFY